jgi:hypothetical protein
MPNLPTLHSALDADQLCVQNMMQLYTYDFSEWASISLGADVQPTRHQATGFWRRINGDFTLGEYEEVPVRIGGFDCLQQRFSSPVRG